jgi:D-tyrosyl-tRNA(Tyr) deacylase
VRIILQRVQKASVEINDEVVGEIGTGLLILAGWEAGDAPEDNEWMSRKINLLRIFNDTAGQMNLSIKDVDGDVLLISQFTLHALTKKGNRPSYIKAARPEKAIPLYEDFIQKLQKEIGKPIQTGKFGADMQVSIINDGPVTIFIDSKSKE